MLKFLVKLEHILPKTSACFFYYFHNTSLNLLFLFLSLFLRTGNNLKKMTDYPQLLVYKASAGSGKTFTLAVQYIKQLIEDTHAYRRILAVTFTNKATAEMKKRILEQLFGLANGLKSSDSYLEELLKITSKMRPKYGMLHVRL